MKTSILLKFYLNIDSANGVAGAMIEDYINFSNNVELPYEIQESLNRQRWVTEYCIHHPSFKKCEQLLPAPLRKSSSKIIPVFIDHILAVNWHRYSAIPFEQIGVIQMEYYAQNQDYLPYKINKILGFSYRQNWNQRYLTVSGMHGIMKQMTKKLTFSSSWEFAVESLIEHYSLYSENIIQLLEDLSSELVSYKSEKSYLMMA